MKKILITLAIIILGLQFVRPEKNNGEVFGGADITKSVNVPENVKTILVKACTDCHSNKTEYPWYANIQPLGWWLAHHVEEGKEEINFSEFGTYKLRRKLRKFKEIAEQVNENEMPLESYTWTHGNAKLSAEEKDILVKWAEESRVSIDTVKTEVKASAR